MKTFKIYSTIMKLAFAGKPKLDLFKVFVLTEAYSDFGLKKKHLYEILNINKQKFHRLERKIKKIINDIDLETESFIEVDKPTSYLNFENFVLECIADAASYILPLILVSKEINVPEFTTTYNETYRDDLLEFADLTVTHHDDSKKQIYFLLLNDIASLFGVSKPTASNIRSSFEEMGFIKIIKTNKRIFKHSSISYSPDQVELLF